ncbi:MAG: alpha/beta hydrolase [bacterium]|nr:alpha/beta hydrolase [bacterium]
MNQKIFNSRKEKLDTLVEGRNGNLTIVMVHGFGTSKDENARMFIDISKRLSAYGRIVRFDFAGYGQSEGRQEDVNLNTMADDLKSVLDWVRKKYGGRIMILAHSFGTLVTRYLSPDSIEKTIFTGITPPDVKAHMESTMKRIQSRVGGSLSENGVSIYPRKDGEVQKIGSSHWKILREVDPLRLAKILAQKTDLIIIKPMQDEIVGGEATTEQYKTISGIRFIELDGDHNFTSQRDRRGLLNTLERLIAG